MKTQLCGIVNYDTFKINTTKCTSKLKALSTFLLEGDYSLYKDHKSAYYYQCNGHCQLTDRLFYPGTMTKSHTTVLGRRQKWILI